MPFGVEKKRLVALTGRENARRLSEAGVPDLAWLLRIARTPEGREQLACHTGIGKAQLLTWAHFADLCRVSEIDDATASLLQKAGIRGLRDLIAAEARVLCPVLRRLDSTTRFEMERVARWIRAARVVRPGVHDEAPPAGSPWGESTAAGPLAGLDELSDPSGRR